MKSSLTFHGNPKREYTDITVQIPKEMQFVFASDVDSGDTFERDALLLYPYIMQGRITNGRAAEILGLPKRELMEWYESQGLMCLVTTVSDVQKDLSTLRKLCNCR